MGFFEQVFATSFGFYTAGGLFVLLIACVIMRVTGNFAPVGIFLYQLKPIINLGYKYRIAGINLQSVTTILFLGILGLYVLFTKKVEKSKGYYLTLALVILYVTWVCLSTAANNPSMQALPDVLKSIILVPIFFGGYVFFYEPQNRVKNMVIYLVVINLITVIGYLQMIHIVPYTYHTAIGRQIVKRVTCGYFGPRDYINFVIIGLAFIFYLTDVSDRLWVKIVSWGSFAFWLPVIYYTYLRSGYIALFALIMAYFFFQKKTGKLILFIGIFVIVAMLVAETLSGIFEHTITSIETGSYEKLGHNRLGGWIQMFRYFFNGPVHKWLIGYGAVPVIHGHVINDAHNDYIKVLLETGFVGFALFYCFIGLCAKEAVKCMREHPVREERALGGIAVALFVATGLYGITVRPSDYPVLLLFMISMSSYIFVSKHKTEGEARGAVS
ncbi:MAG: O-antigen ligase family protein [Deltaproteobacteria bacterium]|jgi:O-antigen ligase|nr:O-antigen ligase family protein [Deltaproteobacteria bacterium]